MSQPWSPVLVANVVSATGDLTQLFPAFATAGAGTLLRGELVRKTCEGVLYRVDVDPSDAVGGYFELWDVAGQPFGATNNINTQTQLTNTYVAAEQAAGRARMIWRTDFKGDSGLTTKTFATRTVFNQGLAGRFVNAIDAVGTKNIAVNIVAEGGYFKVSVCG